jgi:hypothetical protein
MKLIDICIEAYNGGSDNFGEKPTGVIKEITYSKLAEQYLVAIELDHNGTKSSTEIGFCTIVSPYKYRVISGHEVFLTDKTPELQKELDQAIITNI